jgi:tetratricopeptide (TPR) repeat protein
MYGSPVLISVIVYANILGNEFIYDDTWTFGRISPSDITIKNLLQYRSFTYLVHRVDALLWQSWMPGFHLTNLILHALASALAASAAFAVTRSRRIGLLCGLFFAVHPVHTEAVASFANRKDILAAIFVFLALVLWLNARRPRLGYVGSMVCYGFALLSKEVAAVALPAMFFLADMLVGPGHGTVPSKRFRRAAIRFAPILVMGIIFFAFSPLNFTKVFGPEYIQGVTERQCDNYEEVLASTAASVPSYARLLFYPVRLSADHPVYTRESLTARESMTGLALVIGWIAASLLIVRKEPAGGFSMMWIVLMLIPCVNVVPLTHFFVAERYLYVPSFGFCALLAIGADRSLAFAERKKLARLRSGILGLVAVLIMGAGIRSINRNDDWHDAYTLWSSAVREGFNTYRAHNNLGVALTNRGMLDEAVKQYHEAIRVNPNHAMTRFNLGNVLKRQGKLDEAIKHYSIAVRINDDFARAHNNLGTTLTRQGRYGEAAEHFYAALRAQPDFAEAHNNLGNILSDQGKLDEAVGHFSEALRINPDYANAHINLGEVLEKQGRRDEADKHYAEALRINPDLKAARDSLKLIRQPHGQQ